MQLEVEISKFDSLEQELCPEAIYYAQLQQLVINPFSDRLHQILNDIFIELNIDESLIKDLKDAKKNKRQKK